MTNITLSIEEEIYRKMKKHSEIRWSEFVRKVIKKRIEELEKDRQNYFLADEDLLAEDWLSQEDNEALKDL